MSNYLTKIIPYGRFETVALEGWFDEMARKGLLLESIWLSFAKFKKLDPCNTRFRLDPPLRGNLKKNAARRLELKEMGWEYVSMLFGSTLYKTDDQNIEFPPPPEGVSKESRQLLGTIITPIILLAYFIALYLNGNRLFLFEWQDLILSRGLYAALALRFFAIIYFVGVVLTSLTALRLHRRKKRGEYPSYYIHTERRARRRSFTIGLLMTSYLCIFVFLALANHSATTRHILLAEYKGSIPFPLLLEINHEEGLEVQSAIQSGNLNAQIDSFLIKDSTILAPQVLMTREIGPYVHTKGYYQSKYAYYVNYYELSSDTVTKKLLDELANELPYEPIISRPGVQAMYVRGSDEQDLLLCYKNIVICVWYNGATDLRDCIPLYEAQLLQVGN